MWRAVPSGFVSNSVCKLLARKCPGSAPGPSVRLPLARPDGLQRLWYPHRRCPSTPQSPPLQPRLQRRRVSPVHIRRPPCGPDPRRRDSGPEHLRPALTKRGHGCQTPLRAEWHHHCSEAATRCRCPLGVISGHTDKSAPCPLYSGFRRNVLGALEICIRGLTETRHNQLLERTLRALTQSIPCIFSGCPLRGSILSNEKACASSLCA